MTKPRRDFTADFKAQLMLDLISGKKTAAELAREHDLQASRLYTWRTQFVERCARAFQAEAE